MEETRGLSRADLSLYRFLGDLIWAPKFKKGRKRKTNVLDKIKKLPFVTLFPKLNVESEQINAVNRINFFQYLDKIVGTSCLKL